MSSSRQPSDVEHAADLPVLSGVGEWRCSVSMHMTANNLLDKPSVVNITRVRQSCGTRHVVAWDSRHSWLDRARRREALEQILHAAR
jgi:hypothetical protein